jgi:hypothetical protein
MAEWVNCGHIKELIRSLRQPWAADRLVQNVMEKTWISFVQAPEGSEIPAEDDPVAEYAMAFYFILPIKGDPQECRIKNDQRLEKEFERIGSLSDVPPDIVDATQLLLGAGIAEPFSTRTDGYLSYNFLLSFACRSHHQPANPNNCVVRHHIKVLAGLWTRRFGLPTTDDGPLGKCLFIGRNHDVYTHSEMRLDAFLLWAKHGLEEKKNKATDRTIWVFPSSIASGKIESDAKTAFCSGYPTWESQIDRIAVVQRMLGQGTVNLQDYDLLPGRLYCRRADVCQNLRTHLFRNIEVLLSTSGAQQHVIKTGGAKASAALADYSAFFVAAAQGAGKTEFVDQLQLYLKTRVKDRTLRECKVVPVDHSRPDRIAALLTAALRDAQRLMKMPTLIILDEAHKCSDLASVVNGGAYNLFDVKKRVNAPIIAIFLTSTWGSDERRIRPWLEKALGCRKDFARRVRYVGLPTWDAEDELLVLGAKITRDFRLREFQIQTDALEFLLIDQPYPRDQLLLEVCDIIRAVGPTRPLRLTDFPRREQAVAEALVRRAERLSATGRRGSVSPSHESTLFTFRVHAQ